jgi:hypothetical protein
VSPSDSPMSRPARRSGNSASRCRRSVERTAPVARTSGLVDGPSTVVSSADRTTAMPLRSSETAKGPSGASTDPSTRSRSPRAAFGGSPNPSSQTVSDVRCSPMAAPVPASD